MVFTSNFTVSSLLISSFNIFVTAVSESLEKTNQKLLLFAFAYFTRRISYSENESSSLKDMEVDSDPDDEEFVRVKNVPQPTTHCVGVSSFYVAFLVKIGFIKFLHFYLDLRFLYAPHIDSFVIERTTDFFC